MNATQHNDLQLRAVEIAYRHRSAAMDEGTLDRLRSRSEDPRRHAHLSRRRIQEPAAAPPP
jgi:hypothetical protein